MQCAPYFQTGHKVTFGLGQTRSGWLTPPTAPASPAPLPPEIPDVIALKKHTIQQRWQELIPIFLSHKKRQGGDRAINTATLWAEIIARQEVGDSLTAIATDLKIPYDTAKKYAQLAKKQLLD